MNRLEYLEAVITLMARDLLGDVHWHHGLGDHGRGCDRAKPVVAAVNCSDTFYWASADSEDILPADLPRLTELLEQANAWNRGRKGADWFDGALVWCCEKRQMRPIKPVFDALSGPALEAIQQYPCREHAGDECWFCNPKAAS